RLVLAFVRMGGEAAPWGVAWRLGSNAPNFLTVPEPRDRDLVAGMMAKFAPVLLNHLGHPRWGGRYDPNGTTPQLWLRNPTHVEMLHHVNYAYTNARAGERDRVEVLRALGRAAGFLFRESCRPGQVITMDASRVLGAAFTFPAEDVRQAHLGFLLAWLLPRRSREQRMRAAAEAEQLSVATSLDPAVENSLEHAVES